MAQHTPDHPVRVDLTAVLVAVNDGVPRTLTLECGRALPSGPLEPSHRSLQAGMRSWVERQTHHAIGHVEQLYTFGDLGRAEEQVRAISISYLALTRRDPDEDGWHDWYGFFPWEDRRRNEGRAVGAALAPRLEHWCGEAPTASSRAARRQRVEASFGLGGRPWNEDLVLQRYELLFEAGLVAEAVAGGQEVPEAAVAGRAMLRDHRRILATGIARLRARIKYNPVFFELMPDSFTLLQLQTTVEALAGVPLHKQNFRRLIEQQALVEETGASAESGRGRPAKLFRFRREVMQERQLAGSRLPLARSL